MADKGKNVLEAAAGRSWNYSPTLQFFKRLIDMAMIEALAVHDLPPYSPDMVGTVAGQRWDEAMQARDWIRRPAPDPRVDCEGYIVSFDFACEVLGLNPDQQRVALLAQVDAAADFDCDEIYARLDYLTANPPDEIEDGLFEAPRVVFELDQQSMFPLMNAA